ncbi:hypothetical protein N7488_008772 [Penicillium malachiteum]|nr:hypothetical protein N7488_008772 [Penicillium malachiteum]
MEAPNKDNGTIFSEFQDPERIALVHHILNNIENTETPRANLFLLWFSSTEQLECIARESEDCDPDSSSSSKAKYMMSFLYDLASDVPGYWVRSVENPFPALHTNKEPHVRRGRNEKLIPTRYFADWWGTECSDKWKEVLSSDSTDFNLGINTEFAANMMTLNPQVHAYWRHAMCAFRPLWINEDKTEIRLGFHWLPMLPNSIKRMDFVWATENPFDGDDRKYLLSTPRIGLFNYKTDKRIVSGDVFTVITDDPQNRPLPSWDLLLLMWHLTRIAAMQGAGEDTDDDKPSSDDDVDQESDYLLC